MALTIHNCLEDSLEKYHPEKLKMAVSHFFKLHLNKISEICFMLVFFAILELQIAALFFSFWLLSFCSLPVKQSRWFSPLR